MENTLSTKELILGAALGEQSLIFKKQPMDAPAIRNVHGMETIHKSILTMEGLSKDVNILFKDTSFNTYEEKIILDDNKIIVYENIHMAHDGMEYPMSVWGLGQVCNTLGMPADYVKKCIVDGASDVIVKDMNYWAQRKSNETPGKEYMARMTSGRLRGFVSNKYSAFDDSVFLKTVMESIPEDGEYYVSNQVVSPDVTKIRVISLTKVVINGDTYSVGFDISNSRVGRSSVKIQLLIFRWICSNGMLMGGGKAEIIKKRHNNIQFDSIGTEINLLIANIPSFLEDVKNWTEKAHANKINSASLEMLMDSFKVNAFNSDSVSMQIQAVMDKDYSMTLFGLTQAITQVAQDQSVFVRENMEAYAGKLLQRG